MLDDYNRPPIFKAPETPDDLNLRDESWKGEELLKIKNPSKNGYLVSVEPVKSKRSTIARRKKVHDLAKQGLTGPEIADKLKITRSLVRQDACILGVSLQLVSKRK